jgi:hypothetical protein
MAVAAINPPWNESNEPSSMLIPAKAFANATKRKSKSLIHEQDVVRLEGDHANVVMNRNERVQFQAAETEPVNYPSFKAMTKAKERPRHLLINAKQLAIIAQALGSDEIILTVEANAPVGSNSTFDAATVFVKGKPDRIGFITVFHLVNPETETNQAFQRIKESV